MDWSQVRNHYPSQWVLVEAIKAFTKDQKRVIEQMSVVDTFGDDSKEAMKRYLKLQGKTKNANFTSSILPAVNWMLK